MPPAPLKLRDLLSTLAAVKKTLNFNTINRIYSCVEDNLDQVEPSVLIDCLYVCKT